MPIKAPLSQCATCKTRIQSEANFCPSCGAPVRGRLTDRKRNSRNIALVVLLAAAASFGATFVASRFVTDTAEVQRRPQAQVAAPSRSGQPVDLSSMTPREAADRLFNRVMAADERGDNSEAMRFAPMAIMAYQRVDELDADARYHIGLLNLLVNNPDEVRKQVVAIEQTSPSHLLGLVLAISLAEKAGDKTALADARARFIKAYDKEIMSGKPEYTAHRGTLVQFRTAATESNPGKAQARVAASAEAAARLFASKCGTCHGVDASGSDKGPPLVHKIYEPSHHGDDSFVRAARQGVRQHHWQFGDMPPVPGVSDEEVRQIVAYVRGLQEKAGIR